MLPLIAVQGPGPAGQQMARWLYTRTYWDMTNDGGIQDQAITGRLRDGSNSIGSIGYTEGAGQVLVSAAELMGRYIAAGGSRESSCWIATCSRPRRPSSRKGRTVFCCCPPGFPPDS